ncbi:MAG: hypothetical protein FJ395_01625 [Verrucomicrobia bacterium]|nr:hypothetical protein [Verrucomicrobiota bacterium]
MTDNRFIRPSWYQQWIDDDKPPGVVGDPKMNPEESAMAEPIRVPDTLLRRRYRQGWQVRGLSS